jgi:hypothetical protein
MVRSSASASEETRKFKMLLVEDRASFRKLFKEDLQKQFSKMLIEEAADEIETLQKSLRSILTSSLWTFTCQMRMALSSPKESRAGTRRC